MNVEGHSDVILVHFRFSTTIISTTAGDGEKLSEF